MSEIRKAEQSVSPLESAVAEHIFGEDHGLSDEQILLSAFVYAKAYQEGVESTKGSSNE